MYIHAENLSLDYPLPGIKRSLLRDILSRKVGGKIFSDEGCNVYVRALDGVDLDIASGDRVGIYGNNGSGKTTLLKVLAGIYPISDGTLNIQGDITSFISMSLGMDPDLTGFENITFRARLLGMSDKQIETVINCAGNFSELGDYLDLPIRTYSNGMLTRLSFSLVTAFEPEILLMDEWLSVGDQGFQEKAQLKLEEIFHSSSISVLVSHDQNMIKRLCNKVFKIDAGRLSNVNES
jgi:lipopolysaccharide transport system ATP-binding protein